MRGRCAHIRGAFIAFVLLNRWEDAASGRTVECICEWKSKPYSRAELYREERVVVKGKRRAAEAPGDAALGAGPHNAAHADLPC